MSIDKSLSLVSLHTRCKMIGESRIGFPMSMTFLKVISSSQLDTTLDFLEGRVVTKDSTPIIAILKGGYIAMATYLIYYECI